MKSIVLIGLESVGKTCVFRRITGDLGSRETNFRGSTVFCRKGQADGYELVDTPGIRLGSDSETTNLALSALAEGEIVALVAKASDLGSFRAFAHKLNLKGKLTFLALTHLDQAPDLNLAEWEKSLGVPVLGLNARKIGPPERTAFLNAASRAQPWPGIEASHLPAFTKAPPPARISLLAAIFLVIALFGLPVMGSYLFNSMAQPWSDALLQPLGQWASSILPPWLQDTLFGGYGLISLGWYSFLWAFPVVLSVGLSLALAEESGLAQILADRLDAPMRKIGMSGRDLVPVLTGFGCNVVAIFHSRSCSRCNRAACVSMISFGSACSYQIGASLSLFGAAGQPWLFLPYLFLLMLVSALHARLWHGKMKEEALSAGGSTSLQAPSWAGVGFRLKGSLSQFMYSAMPIFLGLCLLSTLLSQMGVLGAVAGAFSKPLALVGLPAEAAPAIAFSFLRKDGLLLLNQGEGTLLSSLSAAQLFLIVYLASTLAPCIVTLYTVARELGAKQAAKLASRQALSAALSFIVLGFAFSYWGVL